MNTTFPTLRELKKLSSEALLARYSSIIEQEDTMLGATYLARKILFLLQNTAQEEMDNTCSAKIAPLLRDNPLTPLHNKKQNSTSRDARLPLPGTQLIKDYKSKRYILTVLSDGFEYDGTHYKTLSQVAKKITGQHWNGYLFFGL